jgi:hypothetical protein
MADIIIKEEAEQPQSWYNRADASANFVDRLRLIPRLLMICYGYVFWETTQWFMSLPEPTAPQSAFVSVVVGAGAAWFGLYVGGSATKKK